ncbi:transcriptional repressor [Synechococcus sp. M16CYN]|uniref:Fur family transcriptional regulator n=1 Tax=Synechococcus sp. M16CYN TaxID=3103139 RepID=UPI0032461548
MADSSHSINARQKLLLQALQASHDEMSGQQLHRSLDAKNAMGLATVYRNLRQLHQRGLVRCRHLPSGEALYAPVERDRHHLTCVDCGLTQALEHCPIRDIAVPKDSQGDFDLLFHTLEFFGLCSACRTRQNPSS